MGKTWDGTGVAFDPATWRAVLDVMKPGAHLLAFGGSRTYHRMAVAIEDAGLESGFDVIGIEIESEYIADIKQRIKK